MNYKELSEQIVKKCLTRGADSAEAYIETSRNLSIEIRNGEIETVQEASANGIGLRIIVKNKLASASCNEFTEKAIADTISKAILFAQYTSADEFNTLPTEKEMTAVEGLFDPQLSSLKTEQKIDLLKKTEKLAMKDPRITKSAGAAYQEGEQEIFLANSNGLLKSMKSTFCYYGISVVAEKGEQKFEGHDGCIRRFFGDFKPAEEIAESAAKKAYEMLDARQVKTQKAPVIFDPEVAYAILGGILRAVNGEKVLQGASFLATQLNKKIGSELLTIVDDGILTKGFLSSPFDGEGVPTQRRIIIDKGILKGFMYNTHVAKRAGVKSTGNASRDSFKSLPDISGHNFYIDAGTSSPEEILKETKTGLLVKEVTGYGINPVNGNFSGGVAGFWIENGKRAFPVKELTIAGSADEMLNNIDMMGNDLDLFRNFSNGPTFRIKSMQIGGE